MDARRDRDFEEFWQRWYRPMRTYAREFLSLSDEDREEIVADILQQAWAKRAAYQASYAWSTWLYGIARNHLRSAQRRSTRRHRRYAPAQVDGTSSLENWMDQRSHFQPEAAVLREEKLRAIRKAVETLDQDDREILYFTYHEALASTEIARITGMAEGTVRSRLSRARGRLRPLLENNV